MDMAKSKKTTSKKTVKPVAKKASKPAPKAKAKPAAKPVAKKAAKPAAKKAVKPAPKKAAKPAPKKVVKKAAPKKVAKPAPKKVVKPAPRKVVKPAPKKAVKPVAKKASKPAPSKTIKKAAKPLAKKAVQPAPKKAVKPAAKPVAKPVAKKAAPAPKKAAAPVAPKPAPVAKQPAKAAEQPKAVVAQPVTKPQSSRKSGKAAKPVERYEGKRIVRSELPAKALITIQKPEEEKMEQTHYEFPTLRYSDAELKEFKEIIDKKLQAAREELSNLKDSLESHTESQVGNKSWNMEEGSDTSEMEYLMNQIARLNKFIRDLEMALVRIENKTYGICRATGKLIDKNRLRVVPHATLSMEAKMNRKGSDDSGPSSSAPSAHMGSEGEGFGGED